VQLQRVVHFEEPKAEDQREEDLVVRIPPVIASLHGSIVGEDEELMAGEFPQEHSLFH